MTHPGHGGDHSAMIRLNEAIALIREHLGPAITG
jgi:hypothetical protein